MKTVHIKNGLKQRVNELLGTDDNDNPDESVDTETVPGITSWSIQAAMISNIRRVVEGIVGLGGSRPMKGLWMNSTGLKTFEISFGIGFTGAGDIVYIESTLGVTLKVTTSDKLHVYVEHKMAEVPGTDADGKSTNFIGKTGVENIVYDDYAASKKSSISLPGNFANIVIQSETELSDDNLVYLGFINVSPTNITTIENTYTRGIGPNYPNNPTFTIFEDLQVQNETFLRGTVQMEGDVSVKAPMTIDNDKLLTLPGETGKISIDNLTAFTGDIPADYLIKVKNGIITSIVAP